VSLVRFIRNLFVQLRNEVRETIALAEIEHALVSVGFMVAAIIVCIQMHLTWGLTIPIALGAFGLGLHVAIGINKLAELTNP
jgi:hypothetical protein